MEISRNFDSMLIGVYFSINNLADVGDDLPEASWDAAHAVNSKAYELIEQRLPNHPCWTVADADGESTSPFEVCELSYEQENINGLAGFNVWIYSYMRVNAAAIKALAFEIDACYQLAANELDATAKLLVVHADFKEQVTTRQSLDVSAA